MSRLFIFSLYYAALSNKLTKKYKHLRSINMKILRKIVKIFSIKKLLTLIILFIQFILKNKKELVN